MEYTEQKWQLKLRIETLKKIKINKNDTLARDARNNFVLSLYEAIHFSKKMGNEEQVHYLKGINEALGKPSSIALWMKNPEPLLEAFGKLQQFINENYPSNPNSGNSLRAKAFAGLVCYMLASLTILVCTGTVALLTFFMLPVMPVISMLAAAAGLIAMTVLGNWILELVDTSFGFKKTDSLGELLIYGEHYQDRVNNNLLSTLSIFAPPVIPASSTCAQADIVLEPVYIRTGVIGNPIYPPLDIALEPVYEPAFVNPGL